MDLTCIRATGVTLMLVTLAGCAGRAPLQEQGLSSSAGPASQAQGVATGRDPTAFSSVDDYKRFAARHVMRFNRGHTFSGSLPAMLPAVVVLRITVDESGALNDVWVQRPPSLDEGESRIALASVRRAGLLPRPYNLANGPGRTLSFSETFLFNADMRFQIRTLAPIQAAD